MSISSYAELQTAVANWVHRSDLTTLIPDFIMMGEKRIFREVRCRVMESTLSGTTASGVIAVPSDYLGLKVAYITGSPYKKLTAASVNQMYDQYPLRSGSGTPQKIAREASNFIFGPFPSDGLNLGGVYYSKPTSIQSSANALFIDNPDLYLMAALCESAPYTKSDNLPTWEAKFQSIVDSLNEESRDEEGSGGGMAVIAA